MSRAVVCGLLILCGAFGLRAQDLPDDERQHLGTVLSEAGGSAVDLIRALESHLAKYPESLKKQELIRALAKAAVQAKDQKRVAKYGEAALLNDPGDIPMLDAVCRALVAEGGVAKAKAALEWSRRFESAVREAAKQEPEAVGDRGRRNDEVDRLLGRALLYQAIASGTLGDSKSGVELARKSFDTYPSGEAAAELAKHYARLGKSDEALRAYADAFTIPDAQATDADRSTIRRRMGELHQRAKGSEAGLGDIVLQSYDRTSGLIAERKLKLKQFDPNAGLANPMEFTLTGIDGERLPLASLTGKVVVMDFWATWCGPCRVQHPLYDQVKLRFKSRADVLFLSVNTDEDRASVAPFLEQQGWSKPVYFEGGLSRALRVSSIPTTLVFGKDGAVASRMNGFDPRRFVDMLSARIDQALGSREGSPEPSQGRQ